LYKIAKITFCKYLYVFNMWLSMCTKCRNCRNVGTDWLFIYGFTLHSRIFHLYGDVSIADEGLHYLSLCLALRAFEQQGMFIVPHLLWHWASVFPVSSEGPPASVTSYDKQGDVGNLFSHGSLRVCSNWKSNSICKIETKPQDLQIQVLEAYFATESKLGPKCWDWYTSWIIKQFWFSMVEKITSSLFMIFSKKYRWWSKHSSWLYIL
jgi:hypothetical protein